MFAKPFLNIYSLFDTHIKCSPEKTCLILSNNKTVSYSELGNKVNELCNVLSNKLITPKSLIALYLTDLEQFIVGILACIKLGIAYLPIDTSHPVNYVQQLLKDSSIVYCLVDNQTKKKLEHLLLKKINFTTLDFTKTSKVFETVPAIENDCYVIYTSGTSGSSKGVVIT